MEDVVERALRRAQEALLRFRSATALDTAHDAWEDFLVHWHRAVNKIELKGKAGNGERWLRRQVWNDAALNYLRTARNAGDHGLEAVMEQTDATTAEPDFMMDVGGGFGISSRGRMGMMLAETIGMEFVPERLELATVHTEKGEVADPPLSGGKPMRAVDLAEIGLAFLESSARAVS
jgi:hypothetical protein